MLIYTFYLSLILTYARMTWSHAAITHVKYLIKSQNSTIRKVLKMPWYVRNFHIYKEIEFPHLNNFMHLNLNFHLALENTENDALNKLAEHDHNDPIKRKRPKTDLRLNILL